MTARTPGPLRIAFVHSFYASGQPSGENEAVLDQVGALRAAGHEVTLVAAHTDEEAARSRWYPLRAAATVAGAGGPSPLARLRALDPQVVHVHNLFPNLTRSWVRSWPGPLVATLHNYRPLCAGATLYRDGAVCTACPDGDRWAGLRHGCYRESRVATAPLAWANRGGPGADPLLRRADQLVVLSELSRRTYLRAGLAAERLALVPNFVDEAPGGHPAGEGDRWLFAGRLSAEKGILELLRRWPEDEPLDVVGDGELLAAAQAAAPASVRFLGRLDRTELRRGLGARRGLVFASRCYENAPLALLEALAAGLPVLAFAGSAVAESVHRHGTGAVVGWDEPLAPALAAASARFPALRAHCREVFDRHYTARAWVHAVESVYRAARAARAAAP
ncbi:glycosyltransferase [Streptacidiphilus rugosus]|uniref:glycosyltransferase n=1 Tax=Streptacidiphilus rugosus TaxID=405783 RepID=UPI00068BCFD5|nr:glycosyltransferase [Streptacidiphilus rugosus]